MNLTGPNKYAADRAANRWNSVDAKNAQLLGMIIACRWIASLHIGVRSILREPELSKLPLRCGGLCGGTY
jgi:hypothetical protein